MKKCFCFLILVLAISIGEAQNEMTKVSIFELNNRIDLIGELGKKLGSTNTIEGIVIEGPTKGYDGGPNLIVQMINGSAIQFPIQIPISPYFGDFGDGKIPKIEFGSTYKFRAYETGIFVGIPDSAYDEANIDLQTSGYHFKNNLIIISGEKIEPIEWAPYQFIGKYALLAGIAKNINDTAYIVNPKWKLRLDGSSKWKKFELGKQAEAYGEVKKTNSSTIYSVQNCEKRLSNLSDQVGKEVRLRGVAISLNGDWWFNYRGTDISVENMDKLPNWSEANHFKAIEISGFLEECKSSDNINTELIIRNASWKPIDFLLSPEKVNFR